MATGNEYTTLTGLLKGIADALRAKIGTTAQINAQDFPSNIAGIPKAAGNASTSDVLSGVTFSNKNGGEQTGVMPNNGAVSKSISPGGSYTVPAGYHNGSGTVSANMPSGNAGTGDVLSGKTFSNSSTNGATGTMTNRGAWGTTINPGGSVTIPAGYHNGGGSVRAGSASSALKTQTVSRVINMTSGQNGTWTFTFNQLSTVVGLTRVYRGYHGNTGAPYSSHQKFDYRYYTALDPIKISGNTITLTLSNLADVNSTATWQVTAIGF